MAARRAGVSSMPLKPISASPRSMDWSIDVKVMLIKLAWRPSLRAMNSAISTSKPTSLSGCAGSASTKGAPPSGSPAQRNSRGDSDGSAPKGGKINVVNAVRQATRSGPWARTILERDKAVEKIDAKLVLRRDQKEAKVVILI